LRLFKFKKRASGMTGPTDTISQVSEAPKSGAAHTQKGFNFGILGRLIAGFGTICAILVVIVGMTVIKSTSISTLLGINLFPLYDKAMASPVGFFMLTGVWLYRTGMAARTNRTVRMKCQRCRLKSCSRSKF